MTEIIQCIPASVWPFLGPQPGGMINKDYIQNHERTPELESNEQLLQLIAYGVCVCDGWVLTYKRGPGGEDRLEGLWSCGVGGHIQEHETHHQAMVRELLEETGAVADRIDFIGTLREIDTHVGRVHLGIAYRIQLPEKVIPDSGIWEWVPDIRKSQKNFETWSKQIISLIARF